MEVWTKFASAMGVRTVNTARILVVDDEEPIRTTVCRWFTMRGFIAHGANDGVEALRKCQQEPFDLILLDRDMRHMGGLEALPLILGLSPNTLVVILTGYQKEADLFIQQGAVRVCFKPIRLEDLERTVREVLDARNAVLAAQSN